MDIEIDNPNADKIAHAARVRGARPPVTDQNVAERELAAVMGDDFAHVPAVGGGCHPTCRCATTGERIREVEGGFVSGDAHPNAGRMTRDDLERDLTSVAANRSELIDTLHEVIEERNKLAEFKAYVHKRLDAMGVPHDPTPETTTATGCRISGRLDYLYARRKKGSK